jgi:hypothetical protein
MSTAMRGSTMQGAGEGRFGPLRAASIS